MANDWFSRQVSFQDAFARARAAGLPEFIWRGGAYNTRRADDPQELDEAERIAGNLLDAHVALDESIGSSAAARHVLTLLNAVRSIEEIDDRACDDLLRGLATRDGTLKRGLLIKGIGRLLSRDKPSILRAALESGDPEALIEFGDPDAVIEE